MLMYIFLCISTFGLCFLLMQIWHIYTNYIYVEEFIKTYKNYQFVNVPDSHYIDKSESDPNDIIIDSKQKWRCQWGNFNYGKGYYQISSEGMLVSNDNNLLLFEQEIDCIIDLFTPSSDQIFFYKKKIDPCLMGWNLFCKWINFI